MIRSGSFLGTSHWTIWEQGRITQEELDLLDVLHLQADLSNWQKMYGKLESINFERRDSILQFLVALYIIEHTNTTLSFDSGRHDLNVHFFFYTVS